MTDVFRATTDGQLIVPKTIPFGGSIHIKKDKKVKKLKIMNDSDMANIWGGYAMEAVSINGISCYAIKLETPNGDLNDIRKRMDDTFKLYRIVED